MTLFYFAGLIVLVIAGFMLGRSRAATAGQTVQLHSRPVYHGAFVVVSILIPMLILFLLAVPIADRIVNSQAISALDPALLDDDLKRGAALRDIVAVATGRYSGQPTDALKHAADVYGSLRSWTNTLIVGAGWIFGLFGIAWALRLLSAQFRARNNVETVVKYVLLAAACVAVLTTIGIVFSVLFETIRFFQQGLADRFPVRYAMVAANRDPRRSGRFLRCVRHRAAGRRHVADHLHRHADRGPDRAVRGDLHGRIRHAALPRLCQADS